MCIRDRTYNLRLAMAKVDPHAKNQGQRSNGSNRRVHTDKRTDGRYQTYYRPCYAVDNETQLGAVALYLHQQLCIVCQIQIDRHPNRGQSWRTALHCAVCAYFPSPAPRPSNKKHLKNVGPIHNCEPPRAHSPDVASGTVARRLRIDVHDNADNDNA